MVRLLCASEGLFSGLIILIGFDYLPFPKGFVLFSNSDSVFRKNDYLSPIDLLSLIAWYSIPVILIFGCFFSLNLFLVEPFLTVQLFHGIQNCIVFQKYALYSLLSLSFLSITQKRTSRILVNLPLSSEAKALNLELAKGHCFSEEFFVTLFYGSFILRGLEILSHELGAIVYMPSSSIFKNYSFQENQNELNLPVKLKPEDLTYYSNDERFPGPGYRVGKISTKKWFAPGRKLFFLPENSTDLLSTSNFLKKNNHSLTISNGAISDFLTWSEDHFDYFQFYKNQDLNSKTEMQCNLNTNTQTLIIQPEANKDLINSPLADADQVTLNQPKPVWSNLLKIHNERKLDLQQKVTSRFVHVFDSETGKVNVIKKSIVLQYYTHYNTETGVPSLR